MINLQSQKIAYEDAVRYQVFVHNFHIRKYVGI